MTPPDELYDSPSERLAMAAYGWLNTYWGLRLIDTVAISIIAAALYLGVK